MPYTTQSDIQTQLAALECLAEDVDQAASLARDCSDLCPEAKTLLDLAWYFTEKAIREERGHCSARCTNPKSCQCCRHFAELRNRAESIRRAV